MVAATEQHDAPVQVRTGSRHWTIRLVVAGLALVSSALVSLDSAYAGCHYGDARRITRSIDEHNPRGHARDFTFLGQWIYEGGEVKYVPWQEGPPPCNGPNCHADDDAPMTSTGSQTSAVKRVSPATLASGFHAAPRLDALGSCSACSNLYPISGYPHEYEYPP